MTNDAQRDETNTRLLLLGLGALVVSIALFLLGTNHHLSDTWKSVVNNVAGAILATGLLSAAWDLVGRRRFAAEILAKAKLSADVVDAGIERVTDQYLEDVEWADLFTGVTTLDIVVAYARTWRNLQGLRLNAVAANSKATIRVFLPDPDSADTMKILSDRFNIDVPTTESTVREAIAFFRSLKVNGGATVEVYVRAGDAVFSCYRFDQRAVLTLYSHSRDRTSVPTWVVGPGKVFQFIRAEIEAIHTQSNLVP